MDSKMVNDHMEEVQSSAWPENINEEEKRFNLEKPGEDADMFEGVKINVNPTAGDFHHLVDLTNYSEKGSSHLSNLVKSWEYKQTNVVRLLREELDTLSKQQKKVELEKSEMIKEHRSEEHQYGSDERPFSMLDKVPDIQKEVHQRRNDVVIHDQRSEVEGKDDKVNFWKQRAIRLEKLLEESMKREQIASEKLKESIQNLDRQSSPVEELSKVLRGADNYVHFVLQNAPIIMGHQDNKLRYRFIYNHFPSLGEEDIVGKTDVEIFSGGGVKELQDFKQEVLEREMPGKREVTFETELFGSKTFLIYVEPVFSKAGETIGVNYIGMDVTDQVRKREKMAQLREEIAVQKAKETELNKSIHITEKAMKEKQVLTTISHEIRSPLAGLVSMAEKLSKTKLDKEQTQILSAILSSGDLVQQLINDILDLPKAESGVMSLEATNSRPREMDVLQTDEASLQKMLILEECATDDDSLGVVVGDAALVGGGGSVAAVEMVPAKEIKPI